MLMGICVIHEVFILIFFLYYKFYDYHPPIKSDYCSGIIFASLILLQYSIE